MTIRFVAHKTSSKSRIFAICGEDNEGLEAVTTLGADDLDKTEALVDALNDFRTVRDSTQLEAALTSLPSAVSMAVRRFIQLNDTQLTEATGESGSSEIGHRMWFTSLDDEVEDHLDAAYRLGLGIRLTNEIDAKTSVEWVLTLYPDEEFVPGGAEVRTWPLPPETPLLRTWNSRESENDGPRLPVAAKAVSLAQEASAQGRWVRMHTLLAGNGPDEFDGVLTSEFVVDVFDAPIPRGDEVAEDVEADAADAELEMVADSLSGSRHERDHEMVSTAIVEDWAAESKLLAHLAREHDWRVADITNAGMAILIHEHDRAHGGRCFTEAESASRNSGLRQGLEYLRDR